MIIAILSALITGYILVINSPFESNGEGTTSYFEKIELQDKKISTTESTKIIVEVVNPTKNTYYKGDIIIRLSTESDTLEMSHPDQRSLENVDGEWQLNIPVHKGFNEGGTSGKYVFDVEGSLLPGQTSSTNKIEVEVVANGQVKSKKNFEIKITRG